MTRVAFLAALAVARIAHADTRSSGPLAITAPDAVLGRDTSIELTARARGLVHWVTSTGEVSSPTIEGDIQRVTLTLPAAKYPQLAIVAALDDTGVLVDWVAVPLAGRATIKVDTSPNADVVVDVAGARTEPVRASAAGIAEVSIVVPPGITTVRTIATTRRGTTLEKQQPLGVPPVKSVLAACLADRVVAIATTSTGVPLDVAPAITASTGALAPTTANGIASAIITSTHREAASDEHVAITATVADQQASCELTLHHEPPPLRSPPRVDVAPPPPARPDARFELVSRVGVLTNLGRITTPYASVSLGVRVSRHLVVDASVGGYTSRVDAMTETGEPVDGRLTALPTLVRLAYRRPFGAAQLWLGAGGGIATATSRVQSPLGSSRATSVVPAATAAAGIALHLGPGAVAAEVGYVHATVHEALSGRVGGVVTSVGFAVDL
ncbi:MAG: hypothetical protein HOV81_42420 [Kofleriaceae bacterium]|nr:hypothetical protein [Kofleriaceae bacterium]